MNEGGELIGADEETSEYLLLNNWDREKRERPRIVERDHRDAAHSREGSEVTQD